MYIHVTQYLLKIALGNEYESRPSWIAKTSKLPLLVNVVIQGIRICLLNKPFDDDVDAFAWMYTM